jgi:hypothetical protein
VAWLQCGSASETGRRHRQVHEVHHTEVVLLGLHMDENETVSALSVMVVAVKDRAPTRVRGGGTDWAIRDGERTQREARWRLACATCARQTRLTRVGEAGQCQVGDCAGRDGLVRACLVRVGAGMALRQQPTGKRGTA